MLRLIFAAAIVAVSTPAISADLLSISQQKAGLHERKDRATLKRMLGIDPARTPWCGAWAAYVVRKAGKRPPSGALRAISWLGYGTFVRPSKARPGDVVVLRRHVGFLHSLHGSKFCLSGGNQSNRVKLSCFGAAKVKGVRR